MGITGAVFTYALKTLKAAPAKQAESYRYKQGAAQIPTSSESNIEVKNTLVRWNSTYEMVSTVIKLQTPITAICATQQMDLTCIAAYKKLNDYYTLATNQRWSHLGVATICNPQEKRDAEADLPQLPIEPNSTDDLYISYSPATDILKYWAAKQYQYLIIAAIARDHLAIPATLAPSERVFSNGADILTKRNRLSPETLRYLLCLRDWGHILEVEESEAEDADDEREE
ncbi:hypothetical protein V500_03905 [Pseudogymnoascus sp. VKM F-4518 (FW-2643)]|nr:hypothetical protein V500_03905 [Pseudogymnoascus sp. VKM F-4518 (FW-2643)]